MANWWDDEEFFNGTAQAPKAAPQPRGVIDRFKDAYTSSALHTPGGAEGVVRLYLKHKGYSADQINATEKRMSDYYAKRQAADPAMQGSFASQGGADVGRLGVDIAGNLLGGADPSYVLNFGKTAAARVLSQMGVQGLDDLIGQGAEVHRKIRDKIDPVEAGINAVAGGLFQGANEAAHSLNLGRMVRSGMAHPDFQALADHIIPQLEGGGTLANPKVSPKGATGVMQVMPSTARDPGFGIRPWDGKSQTDLARVGKQYAAVMLHRYDGDTAKVLAAYNAGPGAVDHALAKHGPDWLNHLPDETQKYVTHGLKKTGAIPDKITSDDIAAQEAEVQPHDDIGDFINTPIDQLAEHQASDTGLTGDEQPSIANQASINERLAPNDQLENVLPHADDPNVDEADMNEKGYVRSVVDNRWMPREDAYEEAHQLWVDKNFPEGTVVHGYGHHIDEHGNELPPHAVRAIEDQNSEFAKAREHRDNPGWDDDIAASAPSPPSAEIHDIESARANRDYKQAVGAVDVLHDKVSNLHTYVIENGGRIDPVAAENTRSALNSELQHYEPGSPEHNKLLDTDDMLKEIVAHSGGKPHLYAPDASEKFLSGEPKTDAENLNENTVTPPEGKTLHDYTDSEFKQLTAGQKKTLVDQANEKIYNPAPKVYEPRVPGKTLYDHTDAELKRLSPEDQHALVVEQTKKQFPALYPEELERDRNPPAMDTRGPAARRPNHRANKPENELKGPEDHGDLPSLRKEKKLLLDRLGNAIDQGTPIRREAEAAIAQERARRLADVYKTRTQKGGEAGYYAELSKLKGEMGRPKIESIRHWFTQDEIDKMYDIVKKSPVLNGYETVTAQGALKKLLGADYGEIPTGREVALLARAMPEKASVWKRLLENDEGYLNLPDGSIKQGIVNVAGLPRTLKASFDFSAPFRQGMFLVGRKEFWKAMPGMFKAFFSEGHFEKIQEEIYNRPTYPLMNKAGLETTRNNAGLLDREEAFISQFAEKIPGVRHSERAYISFLNKLRADTFDDFVRKGEALGVDFIQDPHYLKSAARFINSATGRGNLNAVSRDARILSNVFFSPKLMKSRIDMLNPGFYVGLHPAVRKEAAKSGLIYASTVMSIVGLAVAAGAGVETDPRSSDFLKMKIHNTRLDVTGGFQPYVRFYAQFLTGQQKSINTGIIRNLGWSPTQKIWKGVEQGPFKPTTRLDILYRFFENKESPNAGEVTRLLRGTDPVGNKLGTNANPLTDAYAKASGTKVNHAVNEIVDIFTPLVVSDTYQAYQDLGAKGILTAIPNLGGVGVQTYTPKVKTPKTESDSDWNFGDEPKTHASHKDEWNF